MKSMINFLGIIAIAAIIGFTFAACDTGASPGGGNETTTPAPGESVDNPVTLVITKDLGDFSVGSGWYVLLQEIEAAGLYVNLDLSAATMTGTEFNPIPAINTGKNKIVSITLPDVALSIPYIRWSASAFQYFDKLQSVSGASIITIGSGAFHHKTSLTSVNFPSVLTIGLDAFLGTTGLTSVSFPSVSTIDGAAFAGSGLTSITFPASANINWENPFAGTSINTFTLTGSGSLSVIQNGRALVRNNTELIAYPTASGNITLENITSLLNFAFFYNHTLTGANFPAVTHISHGAFWGNQNLTSISLPAVTHIGNRAFYQSDNISEITIAANVMNIGGWHSARIYDFITHYNSQGQAAGTYTFVSGAWTGP